MKPFQQPPFSALPAAPRLAHPYFDVPARTVPVWTEAFGDTPTHVRVLGQGPPLLLIHGLMTSSYSWRYVLEPLSRHFTVYAPDLPGSGRSATPTAPLTPAALNAWFDGLMLELGLRSCRIVGNSMGGYLALTWALLNPRAVERLVVVHAPLKPTPRLYALWLATRLPFARAALAALVRMDPERWVHRNVHYWDESLKSREETAEYAAPLRTEAGLRGFFSQLRDTMDVRALRATWSGLDARHEAGADFPIPLQLIYARQDPMVPPSTGRAIEHALPRSRTIWLDRGSHFAHVDAPDLFLESALPFLLR